MVTTSGQTAALPGRLCRRERLLFNALCALRMASTWGTICLPTQRGPSQSIFGLLSQHNELWTYWAEKTVTSEFVIDCLNNFVSQSQKITLLMMDNARIHTSKAFQACLPGWEEKGLLIFYLPAYSPHLNRIERLWQKVKYEWLKAPDYANTQTLHSALKHIFDQFG